MSRDWFFNRYIVEFDVPATETLQLVEWTIAEGGNGHSYVQVVGNLAVDWEEAKAIAESLSHRGVQGHLVTITSQGEQDFVASIFDGGRTWIGLTDDPAYGGTESFGQPNPQVDGWVWITGEPVTYTNWYNTNVPNNSDNSGCAENFGMMERRGERRLERCPIGSRTMEFRAVCR